MVSTKSLFPYSVCIEFGLKRFCMKIRLNDSISEKLDGKELEINHRGKTIKHTINSPIAPIHPAKIFPLLLFCSSFTPNTSVGFSKTDYKNGENLDLTGGTITVVKSSGTQTINLSLVHIHILFCLVLLLLVLLHSLLLLL